jgi:hypothetical protein
VKIRRHRRQRNAKRFSYWSFLVWLPRSRCFVPAKATVPGVHRLELVSPDGTRTQVAP